MAFLKMLWPTKSTTLSLTRQRLSLYHWLFPPPFVFLLLGAETDRGIVTVLMNLRLGFACRHFSVSAWWANSSNTKPFFLNTGQRSAQNDCGFRKYCWFRNRCVLLQDIQLSSSRLPGMNICAINHIFFTSDLEDCIWKPHFHTCENCEQEWRVMRFNTPVKTMQMFYSPGKKIFSFERFQLRFKRRSEEIVTKKWSVKSFTMKASFLYLNRWEAIATSSGLSILKAKCNRGFGECVKVKL